MVIPHAPITEKGPGNNNKPEFDYSLLVEIFETQYMTMHMRKFLSVEALAHTQKIFWGNCNFGINKVF